jgi:hypothetical protein
VPAAGHSLLPAACPTRSGERRKGGGVELGMWREEKEGVWGWR